MTRRTPALLVLALAVLAPAAASAQQTEARLESTFQMSGRVTAARNVRGEHVGEIVQRTWTFTPLCATGPCAEVRLVRGRGNGADSLILDQTTPGHYAGAGRFFAPLECAGTVDATGEEVPFEIKLHVTATGTAPDGTTVATQIAATYINQSRLNLTRCVIVLGHDTARYTGTDVTTS